MVVLLPPLVENELQWLANTTTIQNTNTNKYRKENTEMFVILPPFVEKELQWFANTNTTSQRVA